VAAVEGRRYSVPRARMGTMELPRPRTGRGSKWAFAVGLVAVTLVVAGTAIGVGLIDDADPSVGAPETSTSNTPPQQPILAEPTCVASYDVAETWPGGFNALVTVRNDGNSDLSGWTVTWTLPDGQQIRTLWNGTLTRSGTEMTVANADWNTTLPAGGETSFGFTADTRGDGRPIPAVSCQQQ
jgi:eukaryotic-like serine/threonine-protein kinase